MKLTKCRLIQNKNVDLRNPNHPEWAPIHPYMPVPIEENGMIACCGLTCEKFIDKDGNVDKDKIEELIEKSLDSEYPVTGKSAEQTRQCRCPCHVEGQQVIH